MSKVIEYPIEVSKINQDTNMSGFQEMKDFIHTLCPLPNHWCNGQPIKNQATIKLPPCQCYIPGKGCMHPENPKNLMVVYKNKRKKLYNILNNFHGG